MGEALVAQKPADEWKGEAIPPYSAASAWVGGMFPHQPIVVPEDLSIIKLRKRRDETRVLRPPPSKGLAKSSQGSHMSSMTDATVPQQSYIDAKVDATRAQNDARFAEVLAEVRGIRERVDASAKEISLKFEGDIKAIHTKLDHVPTTGSMIITVAAAAGTTVVAAVSLMLAALAFGGDRFDSGLDLSRIEARQESRDADQDARLGEILDRFDALDARLDAIGAPASIQD